MLDGRTIHHSPSLIADPSLQNKISNNLHKEFIAHKHKTDKETNRERNTEKVDNNPEQGIDPEDDLYLEIDCESCDGIPEDVPIPSTPCNPRKMSTMLTLDDTIDFFTIPDVAGSDYDLSDSDSEIAVLSPTVSSLLRAFTHDYNKMIYESPRRKKSERNRSKVGDDNNDFPSINSNGSSDTDDEMSYELSRLITIGEELSDELEMATNGLERMINATPSPTSVIEDEESRVKMLVRLPSKRGHRRQDIDKIASRREKTPMASSFRKLANLVGSRNDNCSKESTKTEVTEVGDTTNKNDNDDSSRSSPNARISLWPGNEQGSPVDRSRNQDSIDDKNINIATSLNQPQWLRRLGSSLRNLKGNPNKNVDNQRKMLRRKGSINDKEKHVLSSSVPQKPPGSSFLPTIHGPDSCGYELGIRLYTNDEGYFSAPLPNSCIKQFQYDYDSDCESSFAPSVISQITIEQEQEGMPAASRNDIRTILEKCHREYISPPNTNDLKKMFCGLHTLEKDLEQNMDKCGVVIRLATIQIRPDVLCECVMDAVERAICIDTGFVQKKEKGRIRVFLPLLPPSISGTPKAYDGLSLGTRQAEKDQPKEFFCLDAQLCTKRMSRDCERVLLIQISPVEIDVTDTGGITNLPKNRENGSGEEDSLEFMARFLLDNIDKKETIQAAEHSSNLSKNGSRDEKGISFDNIQGSLRNIFSTFPLSATRKAPNMSLRNIFSFNSEDGENDLVEKVPVGNKHKYPCLMEKYHPIIQASWRAIDDIIQELEDSRLAYCTLYNFQFGVPPVAIPSIDEHYLFQLKSLHRDDILLSSLTSAFELESRARDVEYGCTNLFKLILRTFDLYGIAPPDVPMTTSETAYPLLNSPCETNPPWGRLGMAAMKEISSIINQQSPMVNKGFKNSIKGVRLISSAFQRQDYEKHDEILNKMDARVWERLSQTLDHARECVALLSGSCGRNYKSTEAATDFLSKALDAKELCAQSRCASQNQEVPLLICDIALVSCKHGSRVSSTRGTCYITEKSILLVSKKAVFQGANKSVLIDIAQIELKVRKPERSQNTSKKKLLDQSSQHSGIICIVKKNPSSENGDRIRAQESDFDGRVTEFSAVELVSFVPSVGSKRFKYFVDMVRGVQNPQMLPSEFR